MSIFRFAMIGVVCCCLFPAQIAICQDNGFKVEAVGLSVMAADPHNQYGGSAVLGRQTGVEVHVRISSSKQKILKVSGEGKQATKLDLKVDGGKALPAVEGFSNLSFMSQISEDALSVVVPVQSPQLPDSKATVLEVNGSAVLIVGEDPTESDVTFDLKANEKVKLGPVEVSLSEVSELDFGEPVTMVTFQTSQSMEAIGEIQFLDEGEKQIDATSAGKSSFGFGDSMEYSVSYHLKGSPKKVKAKVKYFKSTKEVKVPVDLKIGLGLGK